ncbi:MAG: hypothetical protein ACR2HM_05790 [Acidimicrobiales bacterium]
MNASTLAAGLRTFETPEATYRERLEIAARTVAGEHEAPVAALVVGSTALRRCSARADLDIVIIPGPERPYERHAGPERPYERDAGPERFSTQVVDGVRVEVERMGRRRALACTEGDGWVWELREAARLGCGVPLVDPSGFGAELADRAAAMRPRRARVEATLSDVYRVLVAMARAEPDPEALRGCLDNLALLALLERPRRYQKPKWALADLLHAGEHGLVDALLAAYGCDAGPALDGARAIIATTYEIAGVPSHETILAMGHAPRYAEASYVSRCLDDADDLAASGRTVEARYVALFTARLAAGLLRGTKSVAGTFADRGGDELARRYLALFEGAAPAPEVVEVALAAADARRARLERPA